MNKEKQLKSVHPTENEAQPQMNSIDTTPNSDTTDKVVFVFAVAVVAFIVLTVFL